MKVLYDYQIFRRQRYGGISRYFTNLVRYATEEEACVTCYHPKNYYYNKLTGGYDYKYESMIFEQLNDTISRYLTGRRLKKGDIQIFHPTYNNLYFMRQLRSEKVVITIHDLAIERFPQRFSDHKAFIEKRKLLIEAADHIIAVSNNTKEEIIDYYNVSPEKITVVYHGLRKEFGKVSIHLRGLPNRYILYVGQRSGNKNFGRFIVAYSQILKKQPDLYLLSVGGGEFTDDERRTLQKLGIEKRVQQRNLNDAVLAACYKQAELFVFPSLYEGFGIPVLEAFAMNCPIILSDIGSFKEIAGQAGTYFDPRSIDNIADTILWALEEENKARIELRTQLGKEIVQHYSLENTYQKTHQVYEEVVNDHASPNHRGIKR